MTEHPSPASGATSGGSRFDERLSVPLWWYLIAVGVGVLLGAEVHMGYPGVRAWIGYAICIPVLVLAMLALGRSRVRVRDGQLQVGSASVALCNLGVAELVRKADRQAALGPELDPAAFVMIRGWIRPLIRVQITDPDDPTPYWVFSVRDAKGLLTAIGR